MAPALRLRVYLLAVIFSVVTYQIYSYFRFSSVENRLFTEKHSSLFLATKPRSTPRLTAQQWPEGLPGTNPAEERPEDPETLLRTTKERPVAKKKRRPLCVVPSDLGPISVNTSDISVQDVEKKYHEVTSGGRYSPPDCSARHKVAIIVPYRDRKKNLATFLNHMHPFLMKQKLEYRIYIVEQKGTHEFNRGKLMNVGFLEAGIWPCYIFHDIDLLPLDERNLYSCPLPRNPRLYDALAALDGNELKGTLKGNFGGVSALTEKQFSDVNGYSNGYWGWGGEDNDLYYRLTASGYTVTQYNSPIARYMALKHKQKSLNPRRYRLLLQTMKAFHRDGLSSLQYQVVSTNRCRLYTHILVDIDRTYHEIQELFKEDNYFKPVQEQIILPQIPARRNSPSLKLHSVRRTLVPPITTSFQEFNDFK